MTGNEMVDGVGRLNITGNVIPEMWYRRITYNNGRPCLNAIIILSEIVYWYRPVEIRDERTGFIKGEKKKFKSDMLQRNYDALAEKFGLTKRQVKDAVDILVDMGVVIREFRNITSGGLKLNNVTFLGVNVEKLEEITYNDASLMVEGEECSNEADSVPPPTIERTTLPHSNVPAPTIERGTNTKITTKITTENTKGVIDSSELTKVTSEPEAPLADVEPILTNKGEEWRPTQEEFEAFCRYHPNVDVKAEIVKMASWAFGNPKKRKTYGGMRKFVTTWLDKEQDRNRGSSAPRSGTQVSKTERTRSEMNRIFEEMRSGT